MLKIIKDDSGFSASYNDPSKKDIVLNIGPFSESELTDKLRDLGIDQRDIIFAFHQASPQYFGVGKW